MGSAPNFEESFGMPQPAAVLSITNLMNPHFFSLFRFLLVAWALPCSKPVGLPHVPAMELFSMSVSVDLCWSATKHMTGKSLCEMRGCVYISTQMFCLLYIRKGFSLPAGKTRAPLRSSGLALRWSSRQRLQCLSKLRLSYVCKIRLRCRNLQRHSQLPTWWTHIFFFLHPCF